MSDATKRKRGRPPTIHPQPTDRMVCRLCKVDYLYKYKDKHEKTVNHNKYADLAADALEFVRSKNNGSIKSNKFISYGVLIDDYLEENRPDSGLSLHSDYSELVREVEEDDLDLTDLLNED